MVSAAAVRAMCFALRALSRRSCVVDSERSGRDLPIRDHVGVSAAIEDLHEAVFGFRPAKPGTAYERLAAVVLAALGWSDVVFNTIERPKDRRAKHQLDVTARHPNGSVERMIVECKDWDKVVGKATLDALVGVRKQVKSDAAAVITTKGFTLGARMVALDEDIALVRLRAFDPTNPERFIRKVVVTMSMLMPTFSDFDLEFVPGQARAGSVHVRLDGADRLLAVDGSPAETIADVLRAHAAPLEAGAFRRRAAFASHRLIPVVDGDPLEVSALEWTETLVEAKHEIVTEGRGNPVLVVEQLDEHGEVTAGRVVVDVDLFAWDIDSEGNVTPRGPLAGALAS